MARRVSAGAWLRKPYYGQVSKQAGRQGKDVQAGHGLLRRVSRTGVAVAG